MADISKKSNPIWTAIKRTFQLFLLLLALRTFCFEMEWYQNTLKPITEPVWQGFFDFAEDSFKNAFSDGSLQDNQTAEKQKEETRKDGKSNKNGKKVTRSNQNAKKLSPRKPDKENPCQSSLKEVVYHQKWQNLESNSFFGAYLLGAEDACNAHENRENLPEPSGTAVAPYYGAVYKQLALHDKEELEEVYEMFDDIGKKQKLNTVEFAEMVVTFIQNIPYVLVHPSTCEESIKAGGFSAEYHQENKPCLANIRFGVASPIEFMYHQKGDCDTRSLLAYLVLSHFGYDAAVFVSDTHSMLGLNLPSNGRSLLRKGKKYYFWETTNTGYALGVVAPNYQNEKWYFALVKS